MWLGEILNPKKNMMQLSLVVVAMDWLRHIILQKNYGIKNIAILEKGWIGGGNIGRNTTILRSNYMHDAIIFFMIMVCRCGKI
jgi:hypothetical protein